MARGISMKDAAAEVDLNLSQYGKAERLQVKASRRVSTALADIYSVDAEKLFQPVRV